MDRVYVGVAMIHQAQYVQNLTAMVDFLETSTAT